MKIGKLKYIAIPILIVIGIFLARYGFLVLTALLVVYAFYKIVSFLEKERDEPIDLKTKKKSKKLNRFEYWLDKMNTRTGG